MKDTIFLKDIEINGRHGCSEEERQHEQLFIVDAELYLDLSRSGKSDDLGDTIDYVQVLSDIKKIVSGTSRNLIETVAQRFTSPIRLLKKNSRARQFKSSESVNDFLSRTRRESRRTRKKFAAGD